MENSLMREVLRWGGAFGFFGLSLYFAKLGYESARYLVMIAGAPLFLFGMLLIWKPLFKILTRPFTLLIDSIFFPGGPLEKPILNLKLPAYYIENHRYEEAWDEYRKILRHYPNETEPYEKLLWLAIEIFEDREEARKILRKARRRHIALTQNYDRLIDLA